jgi:hypothetical protein
MEKFKEYNGILTESGFITGIEMLSAYYMTFKFWVEEFKGQSEIRKKMWYATFKNMGDDDFVKLVETYCLENIYAPQSPTSILEFAKQKYLENQPQAELEFEKVVELNKRYSLRINEDTIMAKIDSEITRSVLKAFKNDFINIGDDNRDMVKKRFITQFNSLLKANSIEQANGLIGIEKNKLLGE